MVVTFVTLMNTGCHKTPAPAPVPLKPPVLKIIGQSNLTKTAVDIKMDITTNGNKISTAGICYSMDKNPTTSAQKTAGGLAGTSTVHLTDLSKNTKYYYRVYATDDQGKTYYSDSTKKFWTYTLKDYDGNYYHAVKIGNQTFTVENLKVTHYRNGDPIQNITGNMDWHNATTGAYCYYNNDTALGRVYGALYNWYALKDPRGLVPQGWHVPTYDEWETLDRYLEPHSLHVGGKLKETGTKHWKAPNTGATNSTGFTALPGGGRGDAGHDENIRLGVFVSLKEKAYFWSSSSFNGGGAIMELYYDGDWMNVGTIVPYNAGMSIRLIRN